MTIVTYHDDKPAINVKLHVPGLDFWPREFEALPVGRWPRDTDIKPIGQTTAGDIVDAAYNIVQSDFWQMAEQIAVERDLADIQQGGRSGGWLEFLYDGTEDKYIDQARWLADYTAMKAWVDEFLADAPRKVRDLAQQIAMDELGERAGERMFATFREAA